VAKPDRHFINVFSAVLGVLIAISLVLIGISRAVDKGPKGARDIEDPLMQASAHERIKPFGEVAVAGKDNAALAIKETPVVVAGTPPGAAGAGPGAVDPTDGKAVYESACVACHGSGLAGAPRIGDKAAWAERIAKGTPTLEQHAIQGFQGSAGMMPPKGGRMDLSDDAVRAAVEHMVAQSR
jgi:cytochrome c5